MSGLWNVTRSTRPDRGSRSLEVMWVTMRFAMPEHLKECRRMLQGNGRGAQIVVLVDEQERALKSPEAAGPSPADAVRLWSAKLGHPIHGVGREDCPLWPTFLECEPEGRLR